MIVGGFPPDHVKIYGGIVTACKTLIKSSLSEQFEIVTVDSTQKSNPIPHLIIRLYFAVFRIFNFVFKILFKRPKVIILFPAIGASLLEKGFMSWVGFLLRIPVFMFPRGGAILDQVKSSQITRIWVRWAFGGVSKVLCQGPAWKAFATETLGFSDEDSPIIYNWTATNELLAIGKKRFKEKKKPPLVILFLGWLEAEKGVLDFLDAILNIEPKNDIKIFIAGGGSCEDKAKAFVNEHNLHAIVTFLGWVEGERLKEVLTSSDILVLPSWAEGFPNAIIEAMAAGLAVIVSSVGNIPEVLTHNSEALLVPPKDNKALVNAITNLINDDDLRDRLALSGHNFSEKNFSIDSAVQKFHRLIHSVTD